MHTVSELNTATVTARYHEMGGERWSKEQRFAWRPWQETTIVETQHELATPQLRTEYVSSGASDTLWRQHVLHYNSWDSLAPLLDGSVHELRTYRPGERVAYDWYRGVQRPAVVGDGATRTGDHLTIDVAEFVQGTGETYQRAAWEQEASGRILEDGEVVAAGPGVSGTYEASARSGQYRVELSTRRDQPDWTFSTATNTVLTFESDRPRTGRTDQLPMMRVGYHVPVGLDNQVRTWLPFHQVRPTVDHPGSRRVATLEVWASFDDGESWDRLHVDSNHPDDTFDARVWHRGHEGAVSLKVRVVGSDGSTMTQSVIRAYGIG